MKRAAGVIGVVCAVLALLLLALGVREEVVIVPLLVIGLAGLFFTGRRQRRGGRRGLTIATLKTPIVYGERHYVPRVRSGFRWCLEREQLRRRDRRGARRARKP